MIELTLIDGEKFNVNANKIKSVKTKGNLTFVETTSAVFCVSEDIFTIMQKIVNSYFEGGNANDGYHIIKRKNTGGL